MNVYLVMKKVITDTNFLLYCMDRKIDFFEWFFLEGYEVFIPKQVITEIKRLETEKKGKLKANCNAVLRLLTVGKFKELDCPGRYVDTGLRRYLEKNKDFYLASMDKELVKKVRNKVIMFRGRNFEILR